VSGLSVSGGHALVVPAIDRRVRCTISLVPMVTGEGTMRALVRSDLLAQVRSRFDRTRAPSWRNLEVPAREEHQTLRLQGPLGRRNCEYEPHAYLRRPEASGAARDWFVEHLKP
jgi:hypothetical protein